MHCEARDEPPLHELDALRFDLPEIFGDPVGNPKVGRWNAERSLRLRRRGIPRIPEARAEIRGVPYVTNARLT